MSKRLIFMAGLVDEKENISVPKFLRVSIGKTKLDIPIMVFDNVDGSILNCFAADIESLGEPKNV